jgi:hypothetical protein
LAGEVGHPSFPASTFLTYYLWAACVTVKVCPAMVRVPVRWVRLLLVATLYVTLPLPIPVLPAEMLIQLTLLTAVQLQLLWVETSMVPEPE